MNVRTLYQAATRPSIVGDVDTAKDQVDSFEVNLTRFRQGRIPESSFLEYRLRHGVYGMRQDGVHMMRSKLPLGLLSPEQLDAFADLTEVYASGIAHLTTRQDIQVHFIPLEKSPDVMRVLANAEMTSREACGNVVRNVTAAELAGVEPGEPFDVTPWGMALARFLLNHPDGQSLGRKFKVTLSGTFEPEFNYGALHDIGATAQVRDGVEGFHVMVGGGLGAVPHEARVLAEFVPAAELLPLTAAVVRVFAEHGEKKNRARARLKFVVAKFGIERFRELVAIERNKLTEEQLGTEQIRDFDLWTDRPLFPPGEHFPETGDPALQQWLRTNTRLQKQPGYSAIKVKVPTGDLTPVQLRGLAQLLRDQVGDTLRIGVDQSLFIRWVSWDRLLEVKQELEVLGLGDARAGGLGDATACPGSDTCKLGITSPRSLSHALDSVLSKYALEPALEDLRIKISGCPNSCAQHHIADIGLFGASRTVNGSAAPHYMLYIGGRPGGMPVAGEKPGSGYGVRITKVPAAWTPEAVDRICGLYLRESEENEPWSNFARRLGRGRFQDLLSDILKIPAEGATPDLFRDVGATESFAMERGVGECAGEVVLAEDLLLVEADERVETTASLYADGAPVQDIQSAAVEAMILGARALLAIDLAFTSDRAEVVRRFRANFYDKQRIFEGVGHYFLFAEQEPLDAIDADRLRRLVDESGLFVEEAHNLVANVKRGSGVRKAVKK